jgi:Ca2+-binding EF-hand superfamily protein
MFQLFDKDNKGLSADQFEEICENLGIYLSKQQLHQWFLRGSKDGKYINF